MSWGAGSDCHQVLPKAARLAAEGRIGAKIYWTNKIGNGNEINGLFQGVSLEYENGIGHLALSVKASYFRNAFR